MSWKSASHPLVSTTTRCFSVVFPTPPDASGSADADTRRRTRDRPFGGVPRGHHHACRAAMSHSPRPASPGAIAPVRRLRSRAFRPLRFTVRTFVRSCRVVHRRDYRLGGGNENAVCGNLDARPALGPPHGSAGGRLAPGATTVGGPSNERMRVRPCNALCEGGRGGRRARSAPVAVRRLFDAGHLVACASIA